MPNSYKDLRLTEAQISQTSDIPQRPSVESLVEKYAESTKFINNRIVLTLTKIRGRSVITKKISFTEGTKRKINGILRKVKTLGSFSAREFSKKLKLNKAMTHNYINILLASNFVISDNKTWSARYTWNSQSTKTCL